MSHTHYFEVNNVRVKHSASPVGNEGVRSESFHSHSSYFQGTAFNAAAITVVTNELANAMKLYSADDIADLKAVVTAIGVAGAGISEATSPWQQRVGKGVWQITAGYSAGTNAAALNAAIAGQVDLDLE